MRQVCEDVCEDMCVCMDLSGVLVCERCVLVLFLLCIVSVASVLVVCGLVFLRVECVLCV